MTIQIFATVLRAVWLIIEVPYLRRFKVSPHKHLRHPAYTGALVAHLGLGLSFSNWFSLALSFVPYLAAAVYRIHVEEQALSEAFGQEYLEYSRDTKRLIPKLY